ncbi:MAG TPA: hypothetical protein VEW05_28180 [Candidatus Polarisedimenticolia bacterium]|nr:hypothetical protein [Candidatus Polarisedimenticolia bacterium]
MDDKELREKFAQVEASNPDIESWPDYAREAVYSITLGKISNGEEAMEAFDGTVQELRPLLAEVMPESGKRPASFQQFNLDREMNRLNWERKRMVEGV